MTTGESIDNIENVTLTSDEAFERVTNDEHFEEEKNGGYLQQNTSGLVQEIPNISFLDIADTTLETTEYQIGKDENNNPIMKEIGRKTLYQKNNWNVTVGSQGKSIELVPQDTLNIRLGEDKTITGSPALVQLEAYNLTEDSKTIEVDSQHIGRINILMDGYYRLSYGWTIDALNATQLSVEIFKKSDNVTGEVYSGTLGKLSGGRTISLQLNHDDYIYMRVSANSTIKVCEEYTYLELQYVRPTI